MITPPWSRERVMTLLLIIINKSNAFIFVVFSCSISVWEPILRDTNMERTLHTVRWRKHRANVQRSGKQNVWDCRVFGRNVFAAKANLFRMLVRAWLTIASHSMLKRIEKIPRDQNDEIYAPCGMGVRIQPTPALRCVVGGDYLRDMSYPLPPAHCMQGLLAWNGAYELG